jgi:hypothetical protein
MRQPLFKVMTQRLFSNRRFNQLFQPSRRYTATQGLLQVYFILG